MRNEDFTKDMLPKTRTKLFSYLLFKRTNVILNMGLIILLFSLPLIIINLIFNYLIASVSTLNFSDEEILAEIISLYNLRNLLSIIGFIILSIGLSGIFYIFRRLIWDEDIIFKTDFKKGIKMNGKLFSIIFLIIGIFNYIINAYFIYPFDTSTTLYKLGMICIIIIIIFIIPIFINIICINQIYNLKLRHIIKNAYLYTMLKAYIMLPLGILNGIVVLLTLIPSAISYYLALFLLPLIIAPIIIIINILVTDSIYDQYVNYDNFKEIYRKGLGNE